MVMKVPTIPLSLTNNGLRDWLIQRVSAIILMVFYFTLMGFFIFHPSLSFSELRLFFTSPWMRVLTLLSLVSLMLHSWIGIWTVMSDYVKPHSLRFFVELFFILLILIYLFWGFEILWR